MKNLGREEHSSGLYYKTITIVIMTIVSDATIWSVTFDAARGVIYDRNMAIPHVYGRWLFNKYQLIALFAWRVQGYSENT